MSNHLPPSIGFFDGATRHIRISPAKHEFSYPMRMLFVELDAIEELSESSQLFSLDSMNIFSIRTSDYLAFERLDGLSLKEKAATLMSEAGLGGEDFRYYLLTCPRVFGFSFNPATFFLCYRGEMLQTIIIQINNTFSEQHCYVLDVSRERVVEFDKDFYVSPFNQSKGAYKLNVKLEKEGKQLGLDCGIKLFKKGEKKHYFYADLKGEIEECKAFPSRLKMIQLSQGLLNLPLIVKEAAKQQ